MNNREQKRYPPLRPLHHLRNLFCGRFFFLLISQGAIFVVFPFLNYNDRAGALLLEALYIAVLLASLRAVMDGRPSLRRIILGLLLVSIVLRVTDTFEEKRVLLFCSLTVDLLFYLIISKVILTYVMKSERVTTDKIVGAICVYVFIGIIFTQVFSLIEFFLPGSFSTDSPLMSSIGQSMDVVRSSALFYFSFITLTTVGFGDVVPLTQPAASFAILEAVTGQVYLTVLVARLVGLHIAEHGLSCASHEKQT